MNKVQLIHGKLNVELLPCNKSWMLALQQSETEGSFSGGSLDSVLLLMNYIYQSYLVACRINKTPIAFNEVEFQDELTNNDVDLTISTREECFKTLSDSVVSNLEKATEEAKKKIVATPQETVLTN